MAYLLPRALIVLIAWGITCGLIKSLWPASDPMAFGLAGATWTIGAIGYFAYLRKLKRDIDELERRHFTVDRGTNTAAQR